MLSLHGMRGRAEPFEARLNDQKKNDSGTTDDDDREGRADGRYHQQQHKDADRQHDFGRHSDQGAEDRTSYLLNRLVAVADEFRRVALQVKGVRKAEVASHEPDRQACCGILGHTLYDVFGRHRDDCTDEEEHDHDPDEREKHRALVESAGDATNVSDQWEAHRSIGVCHQAQKHVHQRGRYDLEQTGDDGQRYEQEPTLPLFTAHEM